MKIAKSIQPKHGPAKETFRDGTLAAAGKYAAGKKTGVWKYLLP
jgi:hypothetical protein